jgi:hypothetical protein
MTLKLTQFSALAALAACALSVPAAKATGFSLANGDILLGFRQSGNNASDYVIDITKLSAAWNTVGLKAATSPMTLSLGTALDTDFGTAFGSATPSGLLFSVLGYNGTGTFSGDGFRTYYLAEPIGGTVPNTSTAQSTQITAISGLAGNYGGLSTGAISSGTIFTPGGSGLSSIQNSLTSRIASNLGNNQLSPIETAEGTTLELFRLPQSSTTPGTDLGTLSFDNALNTLTFTPLPVPEPSTAFFGVLALGTIIARRHRKAIAA